MFPAVLPLSEAKIGFWMRKTVSKYPICQTNCLQNNLDLLKTAKEMSLSVYFLVLPCLVCAVFFPILLLKKNKSYPHMYITAISLIASVALFADSCMVIDEVSDRVLRICELLRILSVPLLFPLLNLYLLSIESEKFKGGLHTAIAWLFIPLALFASALTVFICGEEDTIIYRIICIYAFKGILIIEILTLAIYTVRVLVLAGFGPVSYCRYMFRIEDSTPKKVQTMNVLIIFVLCVSRTAMGREWGIEHEWFSAFLFFLIAVAFTNLFLTALLSTDSSMVKSPAEDHSLLSRFEKLMLKDEFYLTPGITIPMVADRLGTRPDLVTALIRGQYEMSFASFINTKRVEYAKRYMLQHRDVKSAEVADECGYDSAQSFCRAFKNIEGLSPGQWLRSAS